MLRIFTDSEDIEPLENSVISVFSFIMISKALSDLLTI